jgi:hypothetical protein
VQTRATVIGKVRRIAALITVIRLALSVFCLIERQVRQTLAVLGQIEGPGP